MQLNDSQNKYYLCILETPLEFDLDLSLKISNVNPLDRYFEIGLLTQSQYDKVKQTNLGKFLRGTYSYCGYKQKGFKGSFLEIQINSEEGLENNMAINFKYQHEGKKIQITTSKKDFELFETLDVTKC